MAKKKPAAKGEDAAAGGGKKKLVLLVVGLLVIGAAAYVLVLKPKPEGKKKEKPVAGQVVPLEPRQVNLEGGHYLKLGLALQGTAGAEEIDGSKALDAAIELFSGKKLAQIEGERRVALKEKLVEELVHLYHGEVMDVYFTEFVTQ